MIDKQQRTFLLATCLFWFAMYTYTVLLSNYVMDGLRGSEAMAGMVVGSYGFTQMLLRIPVGYMSDRLRRRKPFLIAGIACGLLGALGLLFAGNAEMALVSRGITGMSAATWVCFTVLFSSGFAPEARTRAMGTLSSFMYAAQLAATLAGGALAQRFGVRASFLLAAVAGGMGLFAAARVVDIPPQGQGINPSAIRIVLQNRLLLYSAGLCILLQMIIWSTLYGFSPAWAEHVLGADASQISLLSIVHLVPTILLSRLAGTRIIPKIGEKATLVVAFACIALNCLCIPFTTNFWQMLCLQTLSGAGMGCIAPLLLAMCSRKIAPALQATAMGAFQSLYGIGMFAGPVLAGYLAGFGYAQVFFCAAGIAALGSLLSLLHRE